MDQGDVKIHIVLTPQTQVDIGDCPGMAGREYHGTTINRPVRSIGGYVDSATCVDGKDEVSPAKEQKESAKTGQSGWLCLQGLVHCVAKESPRQYG